MGNIRITLMSVTGRISHVVQTSPPLAWGTLWSSDYLTGSVSGGGGFNIRYMVVSVFENILFLSQGHASIDRFEMKFIQSVCGEVIV